MFVSARSQVKKKYGSPHTHTHYHPPPPTHTHFQNMTVVLYTSRGLMIIWEEEYHCRTNKYVVCEAQMHLDPLVLLSCQVSNPGAVGIQFVKHLTVILITIQLFPISISIISLCVSVFPVQEGKWFECFGALFHARLIYQIYNNMCHSRAHIKIHQENLNEMAA